MAGAHGRGRQAAVGHDVASSHGGGRDADVFLTDPARLSDELRAEMLRHFTPAEIVELIAGLALFMGLSKIAIVLGQEPDDMPTTVIPTPTRPD